MTIFTATDIEEVGWLPVLVLDDIHRHHGQAGAVWIEEPKYLTSPYLQINALKCLHLAL